MSVHKVLILGCGAIAGGYDAERSSQDWPLSHAGAIARDPRFEIAACIDPEDAVRTAFASRWGVERAAGTVDELNAAPGAFDLIVIASPTAFHLEHLRRALALRPKAVFCEKPLGAEIAPIGKLLDRFRASGIWLAVNHTRRWAPDLVDLACNWRAQWGPLISAVGTYSKGIVHNGSHLVDLIQMILGHQKVCAVGPAVFDHWHDDPSVTALLWSPRHACAIHLIAGDSRAFTQFELVLSFERGEVAIRDGGMRIETRRVIDSPCAAGFRQLGPPESCAGLYPRAMMAAYDNIARAIETGAPLASEGESALRAQRICDEIRQRAASRKIAEPVS
jgi:predicted dehydrogenase